MGKNILTKELLLKSVEEWTAAREAYPDLKPDLSAADLRGLNLRGASFSGVDFTRANLGKADLCSSDLGFSKLNEANFGKASLNMVVLHWSDLQGVNLHGVLILEADFKNTHLKGANFRGAEVGYSVFGAVDLSRVIGLHAIHHTGPSTIGIDTIYASNGNRPEVFLRSCGVPDNFIEYARSLTANGIKYYSYFISYSHKNEEFAKRLHTDLQANNVRCWFTPHDLPIGAKTRPAIDDAIRIHDKLLLIFLEQSVQSNRVEHEVEHALDLETERGELVLFPVRFDDAVMDSTTGWASSVKRQRNIGDFTKWKDPDAYQEAFYRLLRNLKQSGKLNK